MGDRPQYEASRPDERFLGIGGSTIAALLGFDTHKGPIDVYNEQVDILEGRAVAEEEGTPRSPKWWGIRQEPIIVEAWSVEHPEYEVLHVPFVGPIGTVRSTTHRFWRATPDALVYDRERYRAMIALADSIAGRGGDMTTGECIRRAIGAIAPDILLECKAHRGAIKFQYGDEGTDEVPDDKRAQVYWTAGLLGIEVAEVPVLFDTNQPRWFRVPIDREILADMLEHADRFMREHVAKRIPPAADGSTSFERHIRAKFGADDGSFAVATEDVSLDVDEIRRLKLEVAMLGKQIDVRSQRVRTHMAAASTLKGPDGRVLATWKRNKAGNVHHKDVAEELAHRLGMTDRELSIVQDEHRGEAPRVFKLKGE